MINKHTIRQLRRDKNLTQKQVADLLGVNMATISGYETGTFKPPLDKLQELAKILGVDTSVLLGDNKKLNENTVEYQRSIIDQLQEEKRRLLDIIDRLTLNFQGGNSISSTDNNSGTVALKLVA